jgi:hypothetical protein
VNNINAGLYMEQSTYTQVMDAALANNSEYGLQIWQTDNVEIHNAGTADNATNDVYVYQGSNSVFSGLLSVKTLSGSCNISSSTNPGLTNGCAVQNGSTATVTTGQVETGLIGQVTTDDATNKSDTSGAAAFSAISDWSGFDRRYRGWGRDAGMPGAASRGACVTGDNCRIWDFDLSSSDSTAARGIVTAPANGNAARSHLWYATTSADCALIPGATWNGSTCSSEYLIDSIEVIGDGKGNDNGLCESGETCIVMPNLGGYQGHGALASAGSIGTGGKVTNVTLMKYATNGY